MTSFNAINAPNRIISSVSSKSTFRHSKCKRVVFPHRCSCILYQFRQLFPHALTFSHQQSNLPIFEKPFVIVSSMVSSSSMMESSVYDTSCKAGSAPIRNVISRLPSGAIESFRKATAVNPRTMEGSASSTFHAGSARTAQQQQ